MARRGRLAPLAILSAVMLTGCFPVTEPDIRGDVRFVVTNDSGRVVQVRTSASGRDVSSDGTVDVPAHEAAEINVPLTANWSIAIDGATLLTSADRPDLVPPTGQGSASLVIEITVDATGPRVTGTRLTARQ